MTRHGLTLQQRFELHVDRSGGPGSCHVWTGATLRGYGKFNFSGKATWSHRVAFFFEHNRWPENCVLHSCDNPPCCNPAHLSEGTFKDNTADMIKKGRNSFGERHANAKLSEQDVRDIRANYALCRVSQSELAQRYGVNQVTISRIVRGTSRAQQSPPVIPG